MILPSFCHREYRGDAAVPLRLAVTLAEDEHAVMVLDQAGWHGSESLIVPANITLVSLLHYSPELHPVERVWLHLKARFSSHRFHDEYDAIVDAARTARLEPP